MTETGLVKLFMHRASREIPHVRIFRRNVLKLRVENRVVSAGLPGQCDCYAYVRGGRVIELEAKSLGGKLEAKQHVWRAWCLAWGVPWHQLIPFPGESQEQTLSRWVQELRELAK